LDVLYKKIDDFKIVFLPTYAKGADLLLIGVTFG